MALAELEGLPLEGYRAFHATLADLLRRLGRSEESRAAYDRAIALAGNTNVTGRSGIGVAAPVATRLAVHATATASSTSSTAARRPAGPTSSAR